ncbi:hypothetical protein [Pinibacter soli]|uniref:Nuclear transport factor 2 family protein n=1 Tax=Pinibacter soli TaxID=3044211 RepID=A0ABT6RE94_9BACT|nr:hypothetical protein [Pinibacter soli]MDI3320898.1 hypothetical protein [Pinibacter soli]
MKVIKFVFAVSFIFLLSCKQDIKTKNTEKLQLVMNDFFDAVQTKNFDKIKNLTDTDFLLYGHGKILNADGLIKLIKGFPDIKTGHELGNFNIDIGDNIANMTYINHYIIYDSVQITKDFLESAD